MLFLSSAILLVRLISSEIFHQVFFTFFFLLANIPMFMKEPLSDIFIFKYIWSVLTLDIMCLLQF